MATAVVLPSFDHAFYKSLDQPTNALIKLRPSWMDVMPRLNSVFVQHNMQDRLLVAVLHRHHDLHNGEVLVERLTTTESITAPAWSADLDPSTTIPHLFRITSDGKAAALEYLDLTSTGLSSEAAATAACTVAEVMHSDAGVAFLSDVSALLKEAGLLGVLGIALAHREFLRGQYRFLSADFFF